MNKAKVVAFLRTCADISDQMCATRGKHPELYRALALAVEQGGGWCASCGGSGRLTSNISGAPIGRAGVIAVYPDAPCTHCHGTGISPELAKLLAELGVGE